MFIPYNFKGNPKRITQVSAIILIYLNYFFKFLFFQTQLSVEGLFLIIDIIQLDIKPFAQGIELKIFNDIDDILVNKFTFLSINHDRLHALR